MADKAIDLLIHEGNEHFATGLPQDRPGDVIWVDAREIIEVDWSALGPSVRWQESRAKAARLRAYNQDVTLIITGFIARKPDGLQTTLP